MFEHIKSILAGTAYNLLDINSELCAERMKICKECEDIKRINNKTHLCDLCGCIIESKTRVPHEKCINGK